MLLKNIFNPEMHTLIQHSTPQVSLKLFVFNNALVLHFSFAVHWLQVLAGNVVFSWPHDGTVVSRLL